MHESLSPELLAEAKAIVALAFRNGPIEGLHSGRRCPTCHARSEYSHITDDAMKAIMKNAVDHVYRLLWLKRHESAKYQREIDFGTRYTATWDDPVPPSMGDSDHDLA